MSTLELVALATLGVTTVSTLMLPFVLRGLNKQDADRARLRDELHERLTHLDACFDTLRVRVMAESITRTDLAEARVEWNETLTRMRAAISAEHHGLHERLFRVEDRLFGSGRQGD